MAHSTRLTQGEKDPVKVSTAVNQLAQKYDTIEAISPTWTKTHNFTGSPLQRWTGDSTIPGTGHVDLVMQSQNAMTWQGEGNSLTTSLHLNPGTGTPPTDTLVEYVLEASATQGFGGSLVYSRTSFTATGSATGYQFGIFGEFGGSANYGPIVIQAGVETSVGRFKTYGFMSCTTKDGGAEDVQIGSIQFGFDQPDPTVQQNRIVLIKPVTSSDTGGTSPSSPYQLDSDAILFEGKSNDGTLRAVWWRIFGDVTSNAGASSFKIQSNLNGGGWNDRFAVSDSGTFTNGTGVTVANLPAAGSNQGARSFVTDSTVTAAGNFGAIVAGTGANKVPVYSDGTNWRIG